jgi:hypothetical protein
MRYFTTLSITKIMQRCDEYKKELEPSTERQWRLKTEVKGEPRNRPRRTHRVSGGVAQLFLNLGTRRWCVVTITPGRLYPRERPGTHCTGGWVGPGAGLDRCGKSRPTGIRSPDLPARSESLYRLRYPENRSTFTEIRPSATLSTTSPT